MRIEHVRISAVWVEIQGSLVLVFGSGKIPVIPKYIDTKSRVGFRERVVELDRLQRRFFRFWKELRWSHFATDAKRSIRIREPNVGQGIRWIDIDCLLEI